MKTQKGEAPILLMEPSSEIHFGNSPEEALQATLLLKNIHNQRVAFKIKSSVKEVYRVDPHQGVIEPAQKLIVNIALEGKASNDAFKVIFAPTLLEVNCSQSQLAEFWKSTSSARTCKLKVSDPPTNDQLFSQLERLTSQYNSLQQKYTQTLTSKKTQSSFGVLHVAVFFAMGLVSGYFYS